jgi:hypothetical protein
MKNQSIVPITYMGGTGGQFVSALCYAAKQSNYEGLKFSKFGNAHRSSTDTRIPGLPGDFKNTFDEHIEKVLSVKILNPPLFIGMHLRDIDRTMETFERAIRITYSHNDIDELALIFLGKWEIETNFCNLKNIQSIYQRRIFFLNKNLEYWQPGGDFENHLLYISWQDLYKNSVDDLTEKLSTFIGFKFDSIVVEKIAEWRLLTENGLDNLKIIMEK